MPLASFFMALGIPQVGRKTGKLLAKYMSGKIGNKEQGTEEREEIVIASGTKATPSRGTPSMENKSLF
jgi:NAD-dependent DNA ligase